jgi:hypothetical protein
MRIIPTRSTLEIANPDACKPVAGGVNSCRLVYDRVPMRERCSGELPIGPASERSAALNETSETGHVGS